MINFNKRLKKPISLESSFEAKIKTLDYIQSIITRLSGFSFQFKKWFLTINFSSVFVLYFQKTSIEFNSLYLLISQISLAISFLILDTFYFYLENRFIYLYKEISLTEVGKINFFASVSPYNEDFFKGGKLEIFRFLKKSFFSFPILIIYIGLGIIVNIFIFCMVNNISLLKPFLN